jgi:sortase A
MADSIPYPYKPGLHSHNLHRRATPPPANALGRLRAILLIIGFLCVGYFAYTWADQEIYQAYQNWALDQERTGQPPASIPLPADGSVIGRVVISRLNLSEVVRQGVDSDTLKEAVGHVPSTALPGQPGNFAIAAHRDTLFRGLKDIKIGDIVTFESQTGSFQYQVVATRIVKPTNVSVLRPDGGGLIPEQTTGTTPPKLLTMITCYPFYYVGSAPDRFIVEARLVEPNSKSRVLN